MDIIRTVILCSDEPHHDYLVKTLSKTVNLIAIVREPGRAQRDRARREGRWNDYYYALYHNLRRAALGLNRYRERYFESNSPPPVPPKYVQLRVHSINSPDVVTLLKAVRPDLVVVMGTSILGGDLLEAAGDNIVNIHGGYLPYYRGNHCFFFALYAEDFDRIGSTIHFVNRGIDTGDIIEHVIPLIRPADNAEMLYCRAERLAIDRLVLLIEAWKLGKSLPRQQQQFRGTLYRTRDRKVWHDLHHFLRRLTGRHRRAWRKWWAMRMDSPRELSSDDTLAGWLAVADTAALLSRNSSQLPPFGREE